MNIKIIHISVLLIFITLDYNAQDRYTTSEYVDNNDHFYFEGETHYSNMLNESIVEDFRVNEQVGNSQKLYIRSAFNNNGISATVWTDYRDGTANIYLQLIDMTGKIISRNLKINSADDTRTYTFPDIAVNRENQFLIVWFDWRKSYAIYGQIIDENGSFIGENFEISDEDISSYKTNPAIGSNGKEFIVSWTDGREGRNYDIFAQRLDVNGSKIGKNFIVNTDTQSVSKYYSDITLDHDGNVFVTWTSTIEGKNNVYSISLDSNNSPKSSQIQINEMTSEVSFIYNPKVSICNSGFVVIWYRIMSGSYDVFGQLLNTSGDIVDSNFVINDNTGSYRYNPMIDSDSTGNFRVTWYDYRNGYAQVYAQDFINNNFAGENFKVSENEMNSSKSFVTCSMNDNRMFISSWLDFNESTEYRIYSKIMDSELNSVSPSIRIDDDEYSSLESDPEIEVFDDGTSIIAWTDRRFRGFQTYFQRYDTDGSPIGQNTSTQTSGSQYKPQIVKLNESNFLLLWREYIRENSNQNEIVAQKYFKSGEKIGEKFIVSFSDKKGQSDKPAASSNRNGEFIISWEKRINNNTRIYAQKYDSNNDKVGNIILVSTDTTTNHYYPSVGIDSSGNFAIVYYGYNVNNYDIYLKRFNTFGKELGSSIIVNDDNQSRSQYYPDISVNGSGDCIITWMDYRRKSGIYFQKYKNLGSLESFEKVDSNIVIVDYQIGTSFSSVSINEIGKFAISWTEQTSTHHNLKFRIYDEDSQPLSEALNLTKSLDRDQLNQNILFVDDKIYNVWQDNHEYGVGYDIWANVFDYQDLLTSIGKPVGQISSEFALHQNYPNPFNPETTIEYNIPGAIQGSKISKVTLKIYDILGREMKTLVNANLTPGNYKIKFNATELSSGIYFYTLNIGNTIQTKKMILMK